LGPETKALSTHRQAQAEAMQTDSQIFWASFPDVGNHSHTQHTPVQHTSSPAAIIVIRTRIINKANDNHIHWPLIMGGLFPHKGMSLLVIFCGM
jgi:hypothetical protein